MPLQPMSNELVIFSAKLATLLSASSLKIRFNFFCVFAIVSSKLYVELSISLVDVVDLLLRVEHPPPDKILIFLFLLLDVLGESLQFFFGNLITGLKVILSVLSTYIISKFFLLIVHFFVKGQALHSSLISSVPHVLD